MNQQHDSQPFFLYGKAFHRINQLPKVDKIYAVIFDGSTFHLTREQTLLLSTSADKVNRKYGKPFEIGHPPTYIGKQDVLSCFNSLFCLFNDSEQIEINSDNKSTFLFLSQQLDNPCLKMVCLKVNFDSPQYFFFSSERFMQIPQQTFSHLFDLTIYINNKAFFCNSIFASCLSNAFFELKLQNLAKQEIHFDNIDFGETLLSFLRILNGFSFFVLPFAIDSLQSVIDLLGVQSFSRELPTPTTFENAVQFLSNLVFSDFELQFEDSCSLIARNFSRLSSTDFLDLTNKALERILSLENLRLPSETFLLKRIIECPQKSTY
jgi:hypothetical protein